MNMTIEINGETYLNTKEACEFLGVSRTTLYTYTKERKLFKTYTRGIARTQYYKQVELEKFLRLRPSSEG